MSDGALREGLRDHLAFCSGGGFCSLDDCLCDCHIAQPAPALDVAWAALERERNFNASDIEVILRKYESGDGYHEPHEVGWRAEMHAWGAFSGMTKPYIGDISPDPAEALLSLRDRLAASQPVTEEHHD